MRIPVQVCLKLRRKTFQRSWHLVSTASPLSKHHPTIVNFSPIGRNHQIVRVPPLLPQSITDEQNSSEIEEWSQDVVEWLGLVALESDRVRYNSGVDPYLCRWAFPEGTNEHPIPVRVLRWKGMVDSSWVTQLLITCM